MKQEDAGLSFTFLRVFYLLYNHKLPSYTCLLETTTAQLITIYTCTCKVTIKNGRTLECTILCKVYTNQ